MELLIVTKSYFITGTDTNVGKTTTCVSLLRLAKLLGISAVGYKPVASGSKVTTEGLRNSDALMLQRNSNVTLAYDEVNPYTFIESTSPHIASSNEKCEILFSVISTGLFILKTKADLVLVEGAGGWFTPLTSNLTFADWVILEKLPVILVVGIKLGCINHALLTELAIHQARLHLVGWIANYDSLSNKKYARYTEYVNTLRQSLDSPFLGEISWFNNLNDYKVIREFFNSKNLL